MSEADTERPEPTADLSAPPSPPADDFNESSPSSSSDEVSTPTRAPSPPRWRFVNEAKSIYGYNSLAAGKVVQGKTADELGAKYIAPDVSLYTPKKEEEDVGQLSIVETSREEEELPTGEFAGLPEKDEVIGKEPKKYREWDNAYHVPPKMLKDYKWYDGEIDDLYNACNESIAKSGREVGQFEIHQFQPPKDGLNGDYNRKVKGGGDDEDGQPSSRQSFASETDVNLRPDVYVMNDTSSTTSSENKLLPRGVVNDEEKWLGKKSFRHSMLFLLMFFIILLGVVLGTTTKEEPITQAAAAIAIVPSNSTEVPSAMPSTSDWNSETSTSCPSGTKEFSLDFSIPNALRDVHNATWELIDSCTGEVVSKCLPCSLGQLAEGKKMKNSDGNLEMEIFEPTTETQCISSGTKYNFHVYSTDNSDACCGFDVTSFTVKYGDELHYVPDDILSSMEGIDFTIYPGDNDGPCMDKKPSLSPTEVPTFKATENPSKTPTNTPSTAPSSNPTDAKTCTTKSDFNICLALDNSGSVCNHGWGECLLCEPSLFCQNFFSFIPKRTCCQNYIDMIEFSKTMVSALDQFEGKKSFSVVQFSTGGQVISNLASADETLMVLDEAQYQGGSTDHADAIRQCQNSLSMADPDAKNFIMLITDGLPDTTYANPEIVAVEEAAIAHGAGTHIIPIFISASYNYDGDAQSFMTLLSNDGEVFDVTGFESLDTLKDSLIQQVSCS